MLTSLTSPLRSISRRSFSSRPEIPSVLTSWVNGSYLPVVGDESSSSTFDNLNPATGASVCKVEAPSSSDVDLAVAGARSAGKEWSQVPASERGAILNEMARILKEHHEEFTYLDSLDTGVPIAQIRGGHIPCVITTLEYFGALATAGFSGRMVDTPNAGGHSDSFAFTRREPLGVCVGIGAWNYPLQTMSWKVAPALACGNTIIYKPSECTPLSAVLSAELWKDLLPPGALQIVLGEGETAQSLVAHESVDKVSLTGSTPTGIKVARQSADTLKHVTLELGGKSPMLVFSDADMKTAARVAIEGNMVNNGEVCSNCTRVFVERSVLDEFMECVVNQLKTGVNIGDNLLEDTNLGPLIMPPRNPSGHFDKVMGYVNRAKEDPNVKLVYGGNGYEQGGGYYVEPTVFLCESDESEIVKEEVFGPVMAVLAFDTEDEAVARANDTEFGLGTGVMTSDVQRAHRLCKNLEAGSVWVNNWNLTPAEVPFGPYKRSGYGREMGTEALNSYSQVKSCYMEMGEVDSSATYF